MLPWLIVAGVVGYLTLTYVPSQFPIAAGHTYLVKVKQGPKFIGTWTDEGNALNIGAVLLACGLVPQQGAVHDSSILTGDVWTFMVKATVTGTIQSAVSPTLLVTSVKDVS